MKHLISDIANDLHYLYSWDTFFKLLLIVFTSALGLWDEIKERFTKKEKEKTDKTREGIETRKNKIYIICLLIGLVIALIGESLTSISTEKTNEATKVRLEALKDSENVINSNLKITMKSATGTFNSLRDFSDRTKKTLLNMQNPIFNVRIFVDIKISDRVLGEKFPELLAQLKHFSGFKKSAEIDEGSAIYNNPSFGYLKYIEGIFRLIGKNDPNDIALEYNFLDFADPATLTLYNKGDKIGYFGHEFGSAMKEDPKPEIAYNYQKNYLEIISKGTITYKDVDLLEFYSPLNFKDKDLLKKYYCGFSFIVGGVSTTGNVTPTTDDIEVEQLIITFNDNYQGESYSLNNESFIKKRDKKSQSYIFQSPAKFNQLKNFGKPFDFKL